MYFLVYSNRTNRIFSSFFGRSIWKSRNHSLERLIKAEGEVKRLIKNTICEFSIVCPDLVNTYLAVQEDVDAGRPMEDISTAGAAKNHYH